MSSSENETPRAFLIRESKILQNQLAEFKNTIDEKYTLLVNDFLKQTCAIENGKVYEIEGKNRRKFKRFVVYDLGVERFDKHILTRVSGWWLNNDNIPTKWDTITTDGVMNPTILVLSDDQTALPHPDKV